MFLVVGILAALYERERSGRGQVVDGAIVDGTASLTSFVYGLLARGLWRDQRGTNLLDTGAPFYDVYETKDARWMAVGALEGKFFAELVRLLELDDVPVHSEPRNWPELRQRITARFKERTREEWAEVFAGSDACVAPILTWTEAATHPHLAARRTLVERDGVLQPAPAPRFSRTAAELAPPPRDPGQDTRQVLTDWQIADVDSLLAAGAAVQQAGGAQAAR
jgi:alpha-methylacyl-CoA racemase